MKRIDPLPAVVALGSNLGDRAETLRTAVAELGVSAGIRVRAVSPAIESVALTPSGRDATEPAYLNAVALIETTLDPIALLDVCQRIEAANGRVRTARWGARTLDLDLIDYAGIVLDSERLTLPHPRAHERDFVLGPWAALAPEAVIPGHGPVSEALAALSAPGGAGRPARPPSGSSENGDQR